LHISAKELSKIFGFWINHLLLLLSIFLAQFLLPGFQAQARQKIYENGQQTLQGLDAGIHPDSPRRSKIDLAGTWQYSSDGEKWGSVKVPSSFDREGKITFQRKFSISKDQLNSSAFKFVAFGINYECEVFINDLFIGKHVGGYTSFEIELPENTVQIGPENTIRVVVQNQLNSRSTVPIRKQIWGWKNYAGILRDVYILATPRLYVDGMQVRVSTDSSQDVGVVQALTRICDNGFGSRWGDTTAVLSKGRSYQLSFEVIDRSSNTLVAQSIPQTFSVEPNHYVELTASLAVNRPKLWSPDRPELYLLRAVIARVEGKQRTVIDEYLQNIGFKNVRLDRTRLLVNGAPVQLKGVEWHEDFPGKGASLTYEQMERDVVLMKSLGINAIRIAFHPPHPYVLNLCSRYGLFVLEELPVWNVPADILGEESFQLVVDGMIQEMVGRDMSYPAVLAWGVGNDFDSGSEESIRFIDRAVKNFRAIDDRPLYCGTKMLETDRCASRVDFAAIHLESADLKNFKRLLLKWKSTHHNQPVLLLGYGKEVEHKNRNGWSDPLSQEHQARFFLQYYAVVREAGIAGSFVSAFADWRGDRPILTMNTNDSYMHPLGLVSQRREKRLAFDMVRAQYGDERTSALPPGSQKTKFPVAHVIAGFLVILVIGYQYAYNRRFSEAVKRALFRSYNFYSDLRDFRAVSQAQTMMLAAMVSITLALIVSSIFYHYRTDKFFDFVLTYVLVSDAVKDIVIYATWNPIQGILLFSFLFFALSLFLTLLIKLCSRIVRTKISWFHAYGVTVWGALPIVFLSAVGMILFKVMENPLYVVPSIILIAVFLGWAIMRIVSGISIVYDISSAKGHLGALVVAVVLLGGVFFYFESVYAIMGSIRFAYDLARSIG